MTTPPKALLFDVFGTLVDWRTSIARESEQVLKPLGVTADWLAFADAWRGEYQGAMDQVRDGHIPFCKLDVLRRRHLLAPCSNGNISLMVDLARRNGIHWDASLASEIAGAYNPKQRHHLD